MSFSTRDKDNDLHRRNCALDNNSGWWFNSCYSANLNGVYRDAGWLVLGLTILTILGILGTLGILTTLTILTILGILGILGTLGILTTLTILTILSISAKVAFLLNILLLVLY